MTIPAISSNINTNISTITTTSTVMITPMLPPSHIVLALTLSTPLACEGVYLCSMEVDSDDDESSYAIKVNGDSEDDDSVDQQSMELQFHQHRGSVSRTNSKHRCSPVMICVWISVLGIKHTGELLMAE